jgi:hypothetical protein
MLQDVEVGFICLCGRFLHFFGLILISAQISLLFLRRFLYE